MGKKSDQPMTDRPLWPFDFKLAAFIRIKNRERLLLATNSRPKFSALKLGGRIEIFLSNEGTKEGKIPHSRNPFQIIFLFNKHTYNSTNTFWIEYRIVSPVVFNQAQCVWQNFEIGLKKGKRIFLKQKTEFFFLK